MLTQYSDDIFLLRSFLISNFQLTQIEHSGFKFYVDELNAFKNCISFFDGNVAIPKVENKTSLHLGNLNEQKFFKIVSSLLGKEHTHNISAYIFYLKICEVNDRYNIIFDFNNEVVQSVTFKFTKDLKITIRNLNYYISNIHNNFDIARTVTFDYASNLKLFNSLLSSQFEDTSSIKFKNLKDLQLMKKVIDY